MRQPKLPGIGSRVREARKQRGWSTHALDEAIGCSHGYTSRLENEDRNLGSATAIAIAKALSVSMTWLLTGEGEPDQDDAGAA